MAAGLGFVGILFVARPFDGLSLSPGLIAGGLAAIGFAGSAIFTRLLTRTETTTCILFYLTTMQAAFGLLCGLTVPDPGLRERVLVRLDSTQCHETFVQ